MPETLLNASTVLLFGRLVDDLRVDPTASEPDHDGAPGHLEQQFRTRDPNFARIYGFGRDGAFHLLPAPTLFLVHGPGKAAAEALAGLKVRGEASAPEGQAQPADPLLPEEVMVWSYDRADYTIRLDIQTGTLDQLLQDGGPDVRGMSLSGMSIQGMSIQGMSIRGMSLRGGDKD